MYIYYSGKDSTAARLCLVVWGSVCLLIISAPLFAYQRAPLAAAVVYLGFSGICHQIADRSFTLLGYPLAVCQRCSGIYLGFLTLALFHFEISHFILSQSMRRIWVVGAVAPLVLDVGFSFAGFWTSTVFSRFLTGFVFGALLSPLLISGMSEFLREARWTQLQRFRQ